MHIFYTGNSALKGKYQIDIPEKGDFQVRDEIISHLFQLVFPTLYHVTAVF